MSVIVTGASGQLGRLVAEELLERMPADELIFVTRHPDALDHLGEQGAAVRHGDFDEPSTLPAAFAGGDRMLLISTLSIGRRVQQHRAAIEAAQQAGVQHIVYTSFPKPEPGHPVGPIATEHGETARSRGGSPAPAPRSRSRARSSRSARRSARATTTSSTRPSPS
jgi:NAD(P)H dehydrogenase (quinone)